MRTAGAHVSGTTAPYNARASEPWVRALAVWPCSHRSGGFSHRSTRGLETHVAQRSYSGMLYSGGLGAQTVKARHHENHPHATLLPPLLLRCQLVGPVRAQEIAMYNQRHAKLSRLGVWGGGGGFFNMLMAFTEQGHGYGLSPAHKMHVSATHALYKQPCTACVGQVSSSTTCSLSSICSSTRSPRTPARVGRGLVSNPVACQTSHPRAATQRPRRRLCRSI